MEKPSSMTLLNLAERRARLLQDEKADEEALKLVHAKAEAFTHLLARDSALAFNPAPIEHLEAQELSILKSESFRDFCAAVNSAIRQAAETLKNANDFYACCIEVTLSHRKPEHPLRLKGAPLEVSIRNQALGPENLIEDDDSKLGEILQVSLF